MKTLEDSIEFRYDTFVMRCIYHLQSHDETKH